MGGLSTFLESFDNAVVIKIYNQDKELLFEGEIGNVPHKIEDQANIILGSATVLSDQVEVIIKQN